MENITKPNNIYCKIIFLLGFLFLSIGDIYCQTLEDYMILHQSKLKTADSFLIRYQYDSALTIYKNIIYNPYVLNKLDTNPKMPKESFSLPIQKSYFGSIDSLLTSNYYSYPVKIENSLLYISNPDIINILALQENAPVWYINKAIDISDTVNTKLYFARGMNYFYEKKFHNVIEDFKKVNVRDLIKPDQYYYYFASAYYELGDFLKAGVLLKEGLVLEPKNCLLLRLYFKIMLNTHTRTECLIFTDSIYAQRDLLDDKYLQKQELIDEVMSYKEMDYIIRFGTSNDSQSWFKERNKQGHYVPSNLLYHNGEYYCKPMFFYARGEYELLYNLYNSVDFFKIEVFENVIPRADLLRKINKIDSAIIILNKMLDLKPNVSEQRRIILVKLFECYKAKLDIKGCYHISQELIEEYPEYALAYEKRGEYYYLLGDQNLALVFFQKALKINKNEPASNFYMGRLLIKNSSINEARSFLLRVYDSNLNDFEILNEVKQLLRME